MPVRGKMESTGFMNIQTHFKYYTFKYTMQLRMKTMTFLLIYLKENINRNRIK